MLQSSLSWRRTPGSSGIRRLKSGESTRGGSAAKGECHFIPKRIVTNPKHLRDAWAGQYQRLARQFAGLLRSKTGNLVEIGCGRGQLTIPLSKLVSDSFFIVDNFCGPYSKDYRLLKSALVRERLKSRIQVIVSDYADWLSRQSSDQYGALISNEFLPEINTADMRRFLSECYRVLKPAGVTVHGFLSPNPENLRQQLVIESDTDSRWTDFPSEEWFSPPPSLVKNQLRQIGFRKIRTFEIKSGLIIKADAARTFLRRWGVKDGFWKVYKERLTQEGLEIPDWIIVSGVKPTTNTI